MSDTKIQGEEIKKSFIFEEGQDQNGIDFCIPYEVGQILGKGGFSSCYSINVLNEPKKYAVKVCDKKKKRRENLAKIENEIEIMSHLNHKGIVKYYRHFQYKQFIYIIMELCQNGTLGDVMKRRKYLSEGQVRYILFQMVHILMHLKQKKVIHRDIKLDNIFLDENLNVKLGDFGLSAFNYDETLKSNICGTPNYIAPEIIDREPFSYEVDVWSTGILIYTLLLGIPPFQTSSIHKTYQKIRQCHLTFNGVKWKISISFQARKFLREIIQKDVKKRLTLEQILNHPFMTRFSIPKELKQYYLYNEPSNNFRRKFESIKDLNLDKSIQNISMRSLPSVKLETSIKLSNSEDSLTLNQNYSETASLKYQIKDDQSSKQPQKRKEYFRKRLKFENSNAEEQSRNGTKKFHNNNKEKTQKVTRAVAKRRQDCLKLKQMFQEICVFTILPKSTKRSLRNYDFESLSITYLLSSDEKIKNLKKYTDHLIVMYWQKDLHSNCLTYLLNNRNYGILFSDNTSFVQSSDPSFIYLIERTNTFPTFKRLLIDQPQVKLNRKLKGKFELFRKLKNSIKKRTENKVTFKKANYYNFANSQSPDYVLEYEEEKQTIVFHLSTGQFDCHTEHNHYKSGIVSIQKRLYIEFQKMNEREHFQMQDFSRHPSSQITKLIQDCSLITKMIKNKQQSTYQSSIKDRLRKRVTIVPSTSNKKETEKIN